MWRRSYLLLLLIRVYFAFSPSYLHPDENFQGPEVIAGKQSLFVTSGQYPADICVQASSLHILYNRHGNGLRHTQFEASFHSGLSTASL